MVSDPTVWTLFYMPSSIRVIMPASPMSKCHSPKEEKRSSKSSSKTFSNPSKFHRKFQSQSLMCEKTKIKRSVQSISYEETFQQFLLRGYTNLLKIKIEFTSPFVSI